MDESQRVVRVAEQIVDAIARRDVDALAALLAPGFLHRTPGGASRDVTGFLTGIREIPGEILFVRIGHLEVDLSEDGAGALVTGVQHARVRVDGQDINDYRAFADWFVPQNGEWRIRVAVDLPIGSESQPM